MGGGGSPDYTKDDFTTVYRNEKVVMNDNAVFVEILGKPGVRVDAKTGEVTYFKAGKDS